jgi:hypothetical protein
MPVFATDSQRLSNLIKKYDAPNNPELFNEVVTVNQAAQTTLKVGTVLGKITASGKYIVAVETAVDGSKVPAAIFIGDSKGEAQDTVITAATDTQVLVLARGKAVVSKDALFLDATYNDATKKNTAYAALKALGVMVEQTN